MTTKGRSKPLRFDVVTIFPGMFDSYLSESMMKRARAAKILEVKTHDLRSFTTDKHHKVDDKPFGGGPGMVLKLEPIERAVRKLTSKGKARVVLFSTRGKPFDANTAERLAKYDRIILICGRYEGVDERVAEHLVDEEISIGDYVLSGGELPALVLIEAVSRFRPGFLGKLESLESVKGSYPTYTSPREIKRGRKKLSVPPVLLSGDHKQIADWRKKWKEAR